MKLININDPNTNYQYEIVPVLLENAHGKKILKHATITNTKKAPQPTFPSPDIPSSNFDLASGFDYDSSKL